MKVLVTGASGFVGRALCDAFLRAEYAKYSIVPAVRSPRGLPGECVVGEMTARRIGARHCTACTPWYTSRHACMS